MPCSEKSRSPQIVVGQKDNQPAVRFVPLDSLPPPTHTADPGGGHSTSGTREYFVSPACAMSWNSQYIGTFNRIRTSMVLPSLSTLSLFP